LDEPIDTDEAKARVTAARVARLATVTPEGRAHLVPCCFAMLGNTIVSAVDGKPKSTPALRRLANIATHPHVSMVIDRYDDDWSQLWWVRVDGTAHTLTSGSEYEASLDALAEKYRQYIDDRPQGAVIVIEPTTWRSWSASG